MMHRDIQTDNWIAVCTWTTSCPTPACALLNDSQVAVFHVDDGGPRVFAIDNYDPNSEASVLSRGLVGAGRTHRGGLADLQAALRPADRRMPGSAGAFGWHLSGPHRRRKGLGRFMKPALVVIGNGMAGMRTVEELLQAGAGHVRHHRVRRRAAW
jgi:hypothetical protein